MMDIKDLVDTWLKASNDHDTGRYLDTYHHDASLEDSTIAEVFNGREEIQRYFDEYFIGYKTQTSIKNLTILEDGHKAHIEAVFNGEAFTDLNGVFELTFDHDKIRQAVCYIT
jgi:ketosteroid isomerase-like protein